MVKIVSWNCNRAFRKKFHLLEGMDADLFVVQECENPEKYPNSEYASWAEDFRWVGSNPHGGLGVFARGGFLLNDADFLTAFETEKLQWFLPVNLLDQGTDLVGVWTKNAPKFSYIGQLWRFLKLNNERLHGRMIFCGDFNSNTIWDHPRKSYDHSRVVDKLAELEIVSGYHFMTGYAHGAEEDATFFMRRDPEKPYYIDYINYATAAREGYDEWFQFRADNRSGEDAGAILFYTPSTPKSGCSVLGGQWMKLFRLFFLCLIGFIFAMILEGTLLRYLNARILHQGAYLEERLSEETLYFGDSEKVAETLIAQGWGFFEESGKPSNWGAFKHPIICKVYPHLIYKYTTCLISFDQDRNGQIEAYSYRCKPARPWISIWRIIGMSDDEYYKGEFTRAQFRCADINSVGFWEVYSKPPREILKQGRTENVIKY